AQWGDEGKGKVIDAMAGGAHAVIRGTGGSNAGHTIKIGQDQEFKMQLVPSGILHPSVWCFIGNGCVVDPAALLEELARLNGAGIDISKFRLSPLAHLVMPWHMLIDRLADHLGRLEPLGTTGRGIGPCYADKATRRGLRVCDLLADDLGERIARLRTFKAAELDALVPDASVAIPSSAALTQTLRNQGEALRPYVADTDVLAREALARGQHVLLEGAQAAMLDIDFGTYPYVTASSSTAAGCVVGSGLSPRDVSAIIGVAKAYTTRVGAGPFPSEMPPDIADPLRERGREYGTNSKRPRRCGWFDAPQVKYACRVSGITSLVLTKLDILSGLEKLQVVTAYEYDNDGYAEPPARLYGSTKLMPVMVPAPGWTEDITGIREWWQLPESARRYVELLEILVGTRIAAIGTGPHRDDMITRPPLTVPHYPVNGP
ncbi:adenylosuccinate synthase, partial [Candidatus Uhrbacteria bacterium]|nr:adenylosuccinate synthase [Candidatus Uhrbacteria bacterium]